tara:strand:+ start:15910 stop:16152 length:243 start_codon:yes stop_codon:yes gene_type:complete
VEEEIEIVKNIDFPANPRKGQGKWQRKLSELDVGDGFYIEETDHGKLSKLRTIYQAAKSLGMRIESVRSSDKRRVIKRVA